MASPVIGSLDPGSVLRDIAPRCAKSQRTKYKETRETEGNQQKPTRHKVGSKRTRHGSLVPRQAGRRSAPVAWSRWSRREPLPLYIARLLPLVGRGESVGSVLCVRGISRHPASLLKTIAILYKTCFIFSAWLSYKECPDSSRVNSAMEAIESCSAAVIDDRTE